MPTLEMSDQAMHPAQQAALACAVVVLNWKGWRDTIACLNSLFAPGATPCRVLVCDNASGDDSLAQLRAWGQARWGHQFSELTQTEVEAGRGLDRGVRLALIANHHNGGFAAGNNVGIRLALREPDCRHVWLLNNDTLVRPDALQQALDRMTADPAIGLCGSTLVYADAPDQVQALGGAIYSRWTGRSRHLGAFGPLADVPADGRAVEAQLSYVVGAALLASRAFIEQVGLMREDYFLYCEEIDWATRGAGRFRLGYAPGSVVFHKEGASIGTSAAGGSALSLYYLYRNRLRIAWRFDAPFAPSVALFGLIDIAKLLARRRWPHAMAALRGLLQLPRQP